MTSDILTEFRDRLRFDLIERIAFGVGGIHQHDALQGERKMERSQEAWCDLHL
jgi:hypothetical protein